MTRRRPSAAIAAQRLRELLVEYRNAAKLTQAQVIEHFDWSESKMHRIEKGPQLVQTSDVIAMLAYYGVPAEKHDAVVQLARDSKEATYSSIYRRVISKAFATYLDYEAYADRIYNYETKFVPGLLQQGDYASSVLRHMGTHESDEVADLRRNLRRQRASTLIENHDGPELRFIVDESALHHAIGGEDSGWHEKYNAMRRVFDHLNRCNTASHDGDSDLNPRISIQVVPFEYGAYRPYRGPYVVLEFDGADVGGQELTERPRLYRENPTAEEFSAESEVVLEYRLMFDRLAQDIPGADATKDILEYIAGDFSAREREFPKRARMHRKWLPGD